MWAYGDQRIIVCFAYEWHDNSANWYRSCGNENWAFDDNGLKKARDASINDLSISETDRKFIWLSGSRPAEHPGLSEPGL